MHFSLSATRPGTNVPGPETRRGAFLAACALVVALFAAPLPSPAAGPWLEVTVEQAKAEAADLLKAGKAHEAYRLYMSLLREAPDDPEVNLGLARAATAAGEHNQAVLALERLVDASPRNARLRYELARAHVRTGDAEAARRELELARRIDPGLTDDLLARAMKQLAQEASPWQWAGRLSAGVIYDSNVNLGPQSSLLQLGPWALQLDSAATRKESWGAYGMASLDVSRRMLGQSPWWLVGDVAMYRKGYFEALPVSRELAWGRAAMGVRRIGPSSLFDLRFKTEIADYVSDDQQARGNGVEGLFVWAARPSLQFLTRASLERRDYEVNIGRQGWYWWVGEYARFLFGQSGHEVILGGRYLQADVDQIAYGYYGLEGSLRVVLKLPGGVELSPFASLREDRYKGPATALEATKRRDDTRKAGVALVWHMTSDVSLDLTWQYTDNISSSALYVYDQNVASVGMTWRF